MQILEMRNALTFPGDDIGGISRGLWPFLLACFLLRLVSCEHWIRWEPPCLALLK